MEGPDGILSRWGDHTKPASLPVVEQEHEPYYRMNIDKANQSASGADAVVIGDFAKPEVETGTDYVLKSLNNEGSPLEVASDGEGGMWLLVGTDSGFEGPTVVYYSRIVATLRAIE